jgi:hypothetical protein
VLYLSLNGDGEGMGEFGNIVHFFFLLFFYAC